MRKSRPRSVFNRKLFNGNMEAFIQVRACLCSLSLSASSAVLLAVLGRFLAFAPQMLRHTLTLPLAPGCGYVQFCNAEKDGGENNQTLNSLGFLNVGWPGTGQALAATDTEGSAEGKGSAAIH